MDKDLQDRLLSELSRPRLPWKTSLNHEAQEQMELQWLPIANLSAARIQLGLSSKARWVRATSESVSAFDPDKPCVFLLPVLEIELDEARRFLERGLEATGLATEFVRLFPFENVVATGLESHSEYWSVLALKWVEQLPPSSKLQSALQSLRDNGPTQKLRHAAQKLLVHRRKNLPGAGVKSEKNENNHRLSES